MGVYLLDSSLWIDFRWPHKGLAEKLKDFLDQQEATFAINGIILAEVLRGLGNSKKDEEQKKYLQRLIYLDISKEDYVRASELARGLDRRGLKLGLPDCIIAANAMNYDIILLATDKHFQRFKGLRLVLF